MAVITYTGPGGTVDRPKTGAWETASNWDADVVPGPEDVVVLQYPYVFDYTIDIGADETIGALQEAYGGGSTLQLAQGATLTVTGAAGSSYFFGSAAGPGAIDFQGGDLQIGNAFVSAQMFRVENASVLAFSYGQFRSVALSNSTLTLSAASQGYTPRFIVAGHSALTGLTLEGAGDLVGKGALTTVAGVGIGGTDRFLNRSQIEQAHGDVVIGDATTGSDVARLINCPGAVYEITDDSGVALGSAHSFFANEGSLVKSGGSGRSVIAAPIVNGPLPQSPFQSFPNPTPDITVSSGTLDLEGAVYGVSSSPGPVGYLNIENGATLEIGGFVGAGQMLNFKDNGDLLRLDDAHDFHANINGFTQLASIDLAGFDASVATMRFRENASGSDGYLLITSGSHSANLFIHGLYQPSAFRIASDGHGGALVTSSTI